MIAHRISRKAWLSVALVLALVVSLLATVSQPASAGHGADVVINEIHADPAGDISGDANGDGVRHFGDDEFVEIYNSSGSALDISGWTLSDAFSVRHVFPASTIIPEDCAIVVFGGGAPAGVFGGAIVQTASTTALGLNNGGDTVTLNDGSDNVAEGYGSEGGNNESLTRDPDITGSFVGHSSATGANGALFSPGAMIDGSIFAGCPSLLGAAGSADPQFTSDGADVLLTVEVFPATLPDSEGITVNGDLSSIGGSPSQAFSDVGANMFTFLASVSASPGDYALPVTAGDSEGRTAETTILLSVVVEPLELKIHEVQGSGDSSPFAGEIVEVEGVVVGDFQGNSFAGAQLDGFFVQEESADWDADITTSEGIFVFAPGAPDVSVGDVVSVTGTAVEFFGKTQISSVSDVAITGAASVALAIASLPLSDTSDLEKYEGMLVTFPQDLYISEFFNYDRFGEMVLTTARQFQGTHLTDPGSAANAVAEANSLARIILDDGRGSQNPDPAIHPNGAEFTLANTFRGGDILQDVTGAMDFSFGRYRLQPVHLADPGPVVTYINDNPRPTVPDPIAGDIRVASFNVLNFFTHTDDGDDSRCGPTGDSTTRHCRGADNATEYQRQLDKLVAGIIALDADIVGMQEMENDIRTNDGDRKHDAVLSLVEALNLVEGAGTWAWVGEADYYNNYPIRNEIIYKPASVVTSGDPTALADPAFDDFRPDDLDMLPLGRPPLAQTFRPVPGKGSRQTFTVVVNHFKSKGSSCSIIGDPDTGDGQANCNLTRVAQSVALLGFVEDLQDVSSGVLVIGDLNSYAMEDPITTLENGGLTELIKRSIGPDAYSFVFDGQLGYLDTALATRSMRNWVVGITVFHINADEPDILDYDTSFKKAAQDALYEALPYRVSDHDPVIIGLQFGGKGR